MQSVLLVQKGSISQSYDSKLRRIPSTVLSVSPVFLAGIKTKDKDGYDALKLTSGKAKRIDKPTQGSLTKSGVSVTPQFVREIRLKKSTMHRIEVVNDEKKLSLKVNETVLPIGSQLSPNLLFKVGDIVDVTGISKGKGFAGVVKRHGFKGGPKTHGQSDRWRSPGSVGMSTTPGRTFKGKRMGGRMGADTVTVKNLSVVSVSDTALAVKGLVPGAPGTQLVIRLVSQEE